MMQPDGSNLAAVLHRMAQEDEYVLKDISIDMANIVPGILKISVRALAERQEFLVEAETEDRSVFSSRILSDGTLRLLALATLKNDPQHRGVLCFEEPENGVHPLRLEKIVNLLQTLTTNFEVEDVETLEPRQVLVNTHSPKLMSYVDEGSLLFVYMTRKAPRQTRIAPVMGGMFSYEDVDKQQWHFTIRQVQEYLDSASLDHRRSEIEELAQSL
jgi:predicted ATPase